VGSTIVTRSASMYTIDRDSVLSGSTYAFRPTLASLRREELLHREDGVAREHVVHRAPDLVRQNRERLPFAVAPFEPRLEPLALPVLAQEGNRRLGERPFEMDIPLLRATTPDDLARRFMPPLHQAGIRGELLHAVEARDVVNLVEDGQRKDLADAGHGPQSAHRRHGVSLHGRWSVPSP